MNKIGSPVLIWFVEFEILMILRGTPLGDRGRKSCNFNEPKTSFILGQGGNH